ncbi:MAG: hypothetical protein RKO24_10545, partial [Candidatus Competibacter sp.]|nr:hypothetical protein [Candidatus Competibacter sp.]
MRAIEADSVPVGSKCDFEIIRLFKIMLYVSLPRVGDIPGTKESSEISWNTEISESGEVAGGAGRAW